LLLPAAFLLQVVFLVGVGLLMAALNVFYRDTGVIADTLMLAWFFMTPVFYDPSDLFPDWQRILYIVNPIASIIAIYREILYSGAFPEPAFVLRTAGQVVLLLVIGWTVFQRVSDRFVEEL
jgi:ABC-type polysaccharide/polyol phosphate export permease